MSKEYDYNRISEEIKKLDMSEQYLDTLSDEAERIGIPIDTLAEILNGIRLCKTNAHITPEFIKDCLENSRDW